MLSLASVERRVLCGHHLAFNGDVGLAQPRVWKHPDTAAQATFDDTSASEEMGSMRAAFEAEVWGPALCELGTLNPLQELRSELLKAK